MERDMNASNKVRVIAAVVDGILKLSVSRPAHTDKALSLKGQSELEHFHVTLARLDDLGLTVVGDVQLPEAPALLELEDEVYAVRNGEKLSCYAVFDAKTQQQLKAYVKACEISLGLTNLLDPNRLFHVTVSNAGGGEVRASVGAVWEFTSEKL
jgi:hypothetical protein